MASTDALCEQAIALTKRYAEIAPDSQKSSLLDNLAYFCQIQQQFSRIEELTEDAISMFKDVKDQKENDKLMNEFDTQVKKLEKIDGKSDKRFLEVAQALDEEADEDIVTVKTSKQVIDPISKCRMVDPVKNKSCGHLYEKKSVLALIQNNPRTRCPIMGCASILNKKDLVPDLELKRYLELTIADDTGSPNTSGILLDDTT